MGVFKKIGELLSDPGDAYWEVPPNEYVPSGPPLTTSLFDDPARLAETWRRVEERRRWEASLTPGQREEIILKAEALIVELGIRPTTESAPQPHPHQ